MAVFVFRGSCYTRFCEDMKQRERERERASPRVCFLSDHFNHVRCSWCLKGVGCRQWGNPDLQLLFYHLHLPQEGSWDWPAAGSRSRALRLPAATTAPPAAERCPGLLWDLLQVHCGMSFIFSEWVVASGSFRTRQRRETRSARVFTKSIY